MRKTVPYVLAWFVAGMVAVGLANIGVSMVGRQVTDSRPAPLSAGRVREELAAASVDGAETTTTTQSTTSTSGPPPAAVPTTTPGSTPPTASPPAPPTTAAPSAPPASVPAAPTTRTYALVGGTATLQFSADAVEVLVATPEAGFTVEISNSHGNGVRVEFRSDDHTSRVDGWWEGGPVDEVREDD